MLHIFLFFFFNDTATTEIYTLSLHDALPILFAQEVSLNVFGRAIEFQWLFAPITVMVSMLITTLACLYPVKKAMEIEPALDRKSTRLNSSHANISYAVFCLKKKKNDTIKYKT